MHSSNWDNLRYVLTVAEHGSLSAAARALGVNHATVLRRVSAFEERGFAPPLRPDEGDRRKPFRTVWAGHFISERRVAE